MKIQVVKEFTFDAAHVLPKHPGKCSKMHGHTYKLQVGVKGKINETGMVMDFGELKDLMHEYIEFMDHKLLNQLSNCPKKQFPIIPTAEAMVEWFVLRLKTDLYDHTKGRIQLSLVRLYETPTSYAEWTEEINSIKI